MIKNGILFLLSFWATLLMSQTNEGLELSFVIELEGKNLELNRFIATAQNDSIQIEVLKFYISNIELYKGKKRIYAEKNSVHLVDASEKESLKLKLDLPRKTKFTQVKFDVGVDSLCNVSGAMGGALDPTKGMYWTWQSGYINFKLEGIAPNCPARKNRFQYHIGGYQSPNYALRSIKIATPKKQNICIALSLDAFFDQIDLSKNYEIMSPNKTAMEFANLFPDSFHRDYNKK